MTTPRKTPARRKPPTAATSAVLTGKLFTYTTSAGDITLPCLADVKMGVIRKNRNDEAELIFALLEELGDEAAIAVVDELTQFEFAQILKRWQEDSQITVGELVASLS